jgi:hypothetical protein
VFYLILCLCFLQLSNRSLQVNPHVVTVHPLFQRAEIPAHTGNIAALIHENPYTPVVSGHLAFIGTAEELEASQDSDVFEQGIIDKDPSLVPVPPQFADHLYASMYHALHVAGGQHGVKGWKMAIRKDPQLEDQKPTLGFNVYCIPLV